VQEQLSAKARGGRHARPLAHVRPLAVERLELRYGQVVAVAELSFAVEPGRVVGLLGPNGCGKTSTLRAVVGLLGPRTGRVVVNGLPQASIAARAQVAYVPDEPDGLDELCPDELFALLRTLYRAGADYDGRAQKLVRAFDFETRSRVLLGALSHGQRRIASMIAAFALARPLVVVDEATAALDPEAVAVLREVIRALARGGGGVLVATQELAFAERVCDDVVLLSAGRVVASGTVAEVAAGRRLEQAFLDAVGAGGRLAEVRRDLDTL
jgi:ABC-2 type transport system ATP-binding protein